ncbi:MAG: hypothetical protein JRI68_27640 [Deltaproteobacteria bacterium]|nr:hypothetical protein [Deltaproteobacteria bacterium]
MESGRAVRRWRQSVVLGLAGSLLSCGARSELWADEQIVAVELCNGLDDDLDGQVDEGIADIECGVGTCFTSAAGCVDGQPGTCTPLPPTPESCNGLDDDCDGLVDEDLDFGLLSGPHLVADEAWMAQGFAPTDTGLLAVWRIAFNGQAPKPNSFAQTLDGLGQPVGPARQLLTDPVVVGPTLAPSLEGNFVVPMCRRFGTNDKPSWLVANPMGEVVGSEHPVSGSSESCTTFDTPPQMVWTGRRHLFTWVTSTSDHVLLESSGADGGGAQAELVTEDGDLSVPPRLVQFGDRVALVAGLQPEVPSASELGIWFLDLDGNVLSGPLALPDPGGSRYLQPRVAVDPDGVMLIVAPHRFDDGWIRARVAFDGTVVSPPELLPELVTIRDLEARPAGGFWAAGDVFDEGTYLFQLDATGEIVARYEVPEAAWRPELAQRAGRVHLLYAAPSDEEQPELHSLTFGCVE